MAAISRERPMEATSLTFVEIRGREGHSPNNRFERSRGASSLSQGVESMIGINQFRLPAPQPRVAQPHR
jgi:hypothetical protein